MEETRQDIDIKDFQSISSANKLDNVLLALSDGIGAKISIDLFTKILVKEVKPSIEDGVWCIGVINTGIRAIGKTPIFQTSSVGIEWKYEDEAIWKALVPYDVLKLKFSDLTPEQIQSLKLTFADLTLEERLSLKGDKGDSIKGDTGLSAYTYAVKGGYQGTEQQFGQEQATIANNSTRLTNVENTKQDKPIAGRSFLTPLFVARGAVFNDKTGYYELNGLTDITESQMMDIYLVTVIPFSSTQLHSRITTRTIFPPFNLSKSFPPAGDLFNYMFEASRNLEVVLINANITTMSYCFSSCTNLTKLVHPSTTSILVANCDRPDETANAFNGCINLEEADLYQLNTDISFADSPKFFRSSVIFMITHAINKTKIITITLHQEAKARLTEEDIALAVSKNITIA